MAVWYSILANWWVYIEPFIVKSIELEDWRVLTNKPNLKHRVIKESTSKIVTQMLVDAVEHWVAENGKVEWYMIAWKTWTSQIAYKWRYEIWQWSTIWTYAWYWPANDPKFVIIVNLERPRKNQYWWQTAAFIFSEISSYILNYYWIPANKK